MTRAAKTIRPRRTTTVHVDATTGELTSHGSHEDWSTPWCFAGRPMLARRRRSHAFDVDYWSQTNVHIPAWKTAFPRFACIEQPEASSSFTRSCKSSTVRRAKKHKSSNAHASIHARLRSREGRHMRPPSEWANSNLELADVRARKISTPTTAAVCLAFSPDGSARRGRHQHEDSPVRYDETATRYKSSIPSGEGLHVGVSDITAPTAVRTTRHDLDSIRTSARNSSAHRTLAGSPARPATSGLGSYDTTLALESCQQANGHRSGPAPTAATL